jgi:hypothetical protein
VVGQGRGQAWRDGGGAAVAGRGQVGQSGVPPGPGGVRPGQGGSGRQTWRRRVWKQCEREKWEKERAGPDTIPVYVHRTDTSADEHKQAGLRGSHDTLCSSATRRT